MSQELTKNFICIVLRNGIEKWIEADRAETMIKALKTSTTRGLVQLENEYLNPADIVGIFRADTMEDLSRRKNGQWKCKSGEWHDRGEKCLCPDPEILITALAREEARRNCKKCAGKGFTKDREKNSIRYCDCQIKFINEKNI